MRYSLHEIDTHHIVATTVAADRDEALDWFSEKLRLMLTFEGDPLAVEYLLDEWAESLRTFNDDGRDQAVLGYLEMSRGRTPAAVDALNAAIALDPAAARPHVYLGVIAARAGKYDDALKQFTTARALQPGYPNIDRLIDEARSRK